MPVNPHATFTVESAVELAVVERSGFIESRHIGAAVVLAGDGTVVTATQETQYTSAGATDVAIQPDGKILTVGPLAYIHGFAAVRYLAS